jgi:hypothetical protein
MSRRKRIGTVLCLVALLVQCGRIMFNYQTQRVYERIILMPMEDYNDAMRCYLSKKYMDAMWKFGIVSCKYPRFFLTDLTVCYMGNSLFLSGLVFAADSVFRIAMPKPPDDRSRRKIRLGKMKCALAMKKWPLLLEYTADTTIRFISEDLSASRVSVYRAVGRAIANAPALEDSILKTVERESDDEELVQTMRITRRATGQSSNEDQLSLLFYLLQYPLPDEFIREKSALMSRIDLKPLEHAPVNNQKSKKSADELIKMIDLIR